MTLKIEFRQARWYTPISGTRDIDLIVWHAAAMPESPSGAEALLSYGATTDRKASWHYAVDSNSVTQSVKDNDVAWHAPGANHDGIGVEQCTVYQPSAADWADPYSQAMFENDAELAVKLMTEHAIPLRWCGVADLLADARGHTDHLTVTRAFRRSDHEDPGFYWPKEKLFDLIRDLLDPGHTPPTENPWPVLRRGDGFGDDPKHVWVVKLQTMLDQLPYVRLKPQDGLFGADTERAVKQFQRRAGIMQTGKVGQPTWRALKLAVHKDGMTDKVRAVTPAPAGR